MVRDFGALWGAAGVLVGFQVTALTLRINREVSVGALGDLTWLPVADVVNLVSLALTLIGVFVLPALDVIGFMAASRIFGLAALLLVGYALVLIGHYELYIPWAPRSMRYFPRQERVAAAFVVVVAVVYVALALTV